MAEAVERKFWPGRKESLLHYRMIRALPEQEHQHKPTKRVAPTLLYIHVKKSNE